jgi:ribose 5-phosphate isomerase B
MRIAVGSDHAGFPLKSVVVDELTKLGHEVTDYGTYTTESVDFPDYAALVGQAIQNGEAERGVLLCGSGVGVSISANKMKGIRASIAHNTYSAHQGVEHDGMNVLCLGGRIIGEEVAREVVRSFAGARFQEEKRFQRRVDKINALEAEMKK